MKALGTVGRLQGEYLKHGLSVCRFGRGKNESYIISRLHPTLPAIQKMTVYSLLRLKQVKANIQDFYSVFGTLQLANHIGG